MARTSATRGSSSCTPPRRWRPGGAVKTSTRAGSSRRFETHTRRRPRPAKPPAPRTSRRPGPRVKTLGGPPSATWSASWTQSPEPRRADLRAGAPRAMRPQSPAPRTTTGNDPPTSRATTRAMISRTGVSAARFGSSAGATRAACSTTCGGTTWTRARGTRRVVVRRPGRRRRPARGRRRAGEAAGGAGASRVKVEANIRTTSRGRPVGSDTPSSSSPRASWTRRPPRAFASRTRARAW
mmetsp:Transcript_9172/g.40383  ORF Transcript_9172/g.40383 Transcript_9172/m.40383 type:complete len:239 (-) Transcript_9172:467-1183(-)